MLVLLNRRAGDDRDACSEDGEHAGFISAGEHTPLKLQDSVGTSQPASRGEKAPTRHRVSEQANSKADLDLRIVLGEAGGPARSTRSFKYASADSSNLLYLPTVEDLTRCWC